MRICEIRPCETWNRLAAAVVAGKKLVLRRVVDVLDARLDPHQVDLVAGDPTVVAEAAILAVAGAVGDQVGLAVGRVLHVLAEIDEVRRSDLYRLALQCAFAEQRLGRRAGRLRPGFP